MRRIVVVVVVSVVPLPMPCRSTRTYRCGKLDDLVTVEATTVAVCARARADDLGLGCTFEPGH